MYGMLIVDDRAEVVKSIEKLGNWRDMRVEVIGGASNGAEAMELIKSHKPKILITDIKMPIMDGLELTKQAKEFDGSIKVILLSGYDEFSYAQEAIKLGAQEYLLKPAKIELLREAVERSLELLNQEERKYYEDLKLKQKVQESLPLLRGEYFNSIIKNPIKDKTKMKEKLEYLGVELGLENFRVMVLSLDDYKPTVDDLSSIDYDLLMFAAMNIIEETMQELDRAVVFKSGAAEICVIINTDSDPDRIFSAAELCKDRINHFLSQSVSIGIGRYHRDAEEITASYREAVKAVQNRLIIGKNSIINIDNIDVCSSVRFKYPYEAAGELLEYIRVGASSKVEEVYNGFVQELYTNNTGFPELIKRYLINFLSTMSRELIENGISFNDIVGDEIEAMRRLETYGTLEEISGELKSIIIRVAEHIYELKKANEKSNIDAVIRYIDDNYAKADLSLSDISKQFFISPSYLSTLIKEHLGETFIERITRLRMDKAKVLLVSGEAKVYEVAENVGYTDRRYFSDIFKKYTGFTPKEYIEKYKD